MANGCDTSTRVSLFTYATNEAGLLKWDGNLFGLNGKVDFVTILFV
jgi:hypothetical protein